MQLQFIGNSLPEGTFKKPSVIFILFSICFAFWFSDFWKPYNTAKGHNNFTWDVMNYYSYLPATFCNNGSFDLYKGADSLFLPIGPKGTFMPKTTYGMSIMYAPFFALGYKIAYNQKSPLSGFSKPFALCLHWGSIFYLILGLIFLRKFLLVYFNESVTALTLFSVLFGTMLFIYGYSQSEAPHGYLFCLFSAFLFFTHKWHQRQSLGYTVLIAITISLISLIRPTEIFIFLFFIFWNVKTWADLKLKFQLFFKNYKHIILFILIAFLFWLPQFLFWKKHTDHYVYFSYPGERFFWNDPQIFNILLSYRKGWLTYTPIIILSFIGFFFVKKDYPLSKWIFIGITIGMVYILSCWWDWAFGGCFGLRAFCQYIAFLSVPMAFFIHYIFYTTKKYFFNGFLTLLTSVFIFSCVCQNVGQTYQYLQHLIHYDSMTKKVYWDIFRTYQFEDNYPKGYWENIHSPDYEKMRSGKNRNQ
jgi:hypothetical protein